MHKKLESELMSIAHSVLRMKNKDDVLALQERALQLYEKLSVLAFVDDYFVTTPTASENKEEVLQNVEKSFDLSEEESTVANEAVVEEKSKVTSKTVVEEVKVEEIEETKVVEEVQEIEVKKEEKKTVSLDDEFKDAVSLDVTADLFEKVVPKKDEQVTTVEIIEEKIETSVVIEEKVEKKIEEPVKEVSNTKSGTSLNDRLMQNSIQIGLNDRIAFVKHLFNQSQPEFNRVISQLNTITSEKEAKDFVIKVVKPDYDWTGKEEYEERFLSLIERKFL